MLRISEAKSLQLLNHESYFTCIDAIFPASKLFPSERDSATSKVQTSELVFSAVLVPVHTFPTRITQFLSTNDGDPSLDYFF